MDRFLIICFIVCIVGVLAVVLVRWARLRQRMARMESQIAALTARVFAQESRSVALPVPGVPPVAVAAPPEPLPEPDFESAPVEPEPIPVPAPVPAAARREWESVLGGNWLNKLGVFVLVVGLALLLRYSFTQFGPGGRVAICLAASLAMMGAGAIFESNPRYRMFARGLLGGGWAALYVTVYAMHAVESARVIESPAWGAVLLLAVAAGMIAHALRYRSQTVAGLAYFVTFGTLAITDMSSLALVASIPLAASLLYVAHRFRWTRMALLGLIATYAVVIIRGDSGAALWEAQSVFAMYWLLFEIFDILHPEAWLLPLNAAGFLGLSILKWQAAAPDRVWILLAAAAVVYVASAAARVRSGKWQGAATLTGALAAGAIFQKLDRQWVASALVVEAELFYLAGIRLRAPYLRWLGTSLFGVEALRLLAIDLWVLPGGQWVPVASLDAVVFYANRAFYAADTFYGYAGAAMVALVIGKEAREPYRSVLWQAAAGGAFAFGWWRRLSDFRWQGYWLLALGLAGTAVETREGPLAVAAVLCYAAALCALRSGEDRFAERERRLVRLVGAGLAVAALMALEWRLAPGEYLGVAWMALAVLLLELGLLRLPDDFRRMAYAAALVGALRVWLFNVTRLHHAGPWDARLMPLWAALLSYAMAARARREERGMVLAGASSLGVAFGLAGLWALLPAEMAAASWAAVAFFVAWALAWALVRGARGWDSRVFDWQSRVVAGLAYWLSLSTLPNTSSSAWATCAAIACLYGAQLVSPLGTGRRVYFSLMATTLTTLLLYYRIQGSMLTMACGIQGMSLLASGFPLRDRALRLSGLVLLLACILKLFVWDLRHLETLPRIFSFIVLGVILLGVSWIYTRFRERVAKFL